MKKLLAYLLISAGVAIAQPATDLTPTSENPTTDGTGINTAGERQGFREKLEIWEDDSVTFGSLLGLSDVATDGVTFSGTIPTATEGLLYYDSNEKTAVMVNDITDNKLNVGKEMWRRVINNTGVLIPDGTVVYQSGFDIPSDKPEIALADATDPAKSDVMGVTTGDIADGAQGHVTIIGTVNGIDTSAFTTGDTVYLDPATLGGMTATKPSRPNRIVEIGEIGKAAGGTAGSLDVALMLDNGAYQDGDVGALASLTLTTDLAIADGGTGASTAGGALTNLGFSAFGQTLIDDATAGDALTTLGVSAFAQTLLDDASAAAAATTLGLGTGDSPTFGTVNVTSEEIQFAGSKFIHTAGISTNVLIGDGSGGSITTGSRNVLIGVDAGDGITDANANTFIGDGAGENQFTIGPTTGTGSIVGIGSNAGAGNNGSSSVYIGNNSGQYATDSDSVVFIGQGSGSSANFDDAIAIGASSTVTGNNGIAIGKSASAGANEIVLGNASNTALSTQVTSVNLTGNPTISGNLTASGTLDVTSDFTVDTSTFHVDSANNWNGFGTATPTQLVDINSDSIRIRTSKTPASASDTGTQGQIAWDASYIYVCTATDTWKRVAISTW